jgi:hypothetical protein
MTGWRLVSPPPGTDRQSHRRHQSHSTSNPTSFAQKGGVVAMTHREHLPKWLAEFDKRRVRVEETQQHSGLVRQCARRLLPVSNIAKTGLSERFHACWRLKKWRVQASLSRGR